MIECDRLCVVLLFAMMMQLLYYYIMMGAVHHIVSVISYIIGVEIGGQIGVEIYRVHVRESMM